MCIIGSMTKAVLQSKNEMVKRANLTVCILVNDVRPKTNEIKKLFDKLE